MMKRLIIRFVGGGTFISMVVLLVLVACTSPILEEVRSVEVLRTDTTWVITTVNGRACQYAKSIDDKYTPAVGDTIKYHAMYSHCSKVGKR
jgi:hypothetical protein